MQIIAKNLLFWLLLLGLTSCGRYCDAVGPAGTPRIYPMHAKVVSSPPTVIHKEDSNPLYTN